jgi:C4-dicarboxylate-specific signal transduction histidine kinase
MTQFGNGLSGGTAAHRVPAPGPREPGPMSQSNCAEHPHAPPVQSHCEPLIRSDASHQAEQFAPVLAIAQHNEACLAEIERLTSTGGFCWDTATDELICTREIYRIFELDTTEPMSVQRLSARIHPDDLPLLREMIDRARRHVVAFECQLRIRPSHLTVKHLKLHARRREGTTPHGEYIGAIQDVTQQRVAEETLRNLRCELARVARVASLGTLSASITHEVNQPLSGIMTNASTCLQMLGDEPPDVDGARATTQRTIRDCERACEVIARLRALFSKQSGKTESLDLNAVASEVLSLSQGELRRRRVTLRADLAERLPAVVGDAVQLQQVILNLLLNAAEAMSASADRPRQILVRTEPEAANHVRLSVQDTGTGFEPLDAERLFEPFYTTKSGGMGIGLSVSRSIIDSHRGRLWAQPNIGAGATFAFSIPAHASAESKENT